MLFRSTHKGKFLELYQSLKSNEPYSPDAASAGKRALRNTCLRYVTSEDTTEARTLAFEQFRSSDNMTDKVGGLAPLIDMSGTEREQALNQFYDQWQANPLVIDKWMTLQAHSSHKDTLEHVKALTRHKAFKEIGRAHV